MKPAGNFLIGLGVLFILFGFLIRGGLRLKWLGRLPGDLTIQRGNFSLYFPLATGLLVSLVLSLILFLALKFFGRN